MQGKRLSTTRRTMLAGLAGLGASAALPGWAQSIRAQSDPWAQVDPYADPRNGHRPFSEANDAPFSAPIGRGQAAQNAPPPPSNEEIAAYQLQQMMADPERFEIEMGRQSLYMCSVKRPELGHGPLVNNGAAQRALQRFCAPFFEVADRPHLPWEVYMTMGSRPNGLAFGGGKLTITMGTVLYADHPGELAGIIAHEIGHNDYRHILRSVQTEALMNLDKGMEKIAGGGPTFQQHFTPFLRNVAEKGFTRDNEREADSHVAILGQRLGMDPGRYGVMMKKMMTIYGKDPNQKTCLLDTHPVVNERLQALSNQIGFDYRPAKIQFTPPGWEELKRIFPTPSDYRWG